MYFGKTPLRSTRALLRRPAHTARPASTAHGSSQPFSRPRAFLTGLPPWPRMLRPPRSRC
eukprot:scaffold75852_cov40-Phaeocystis_antarctica.AAC.3